MKSTKRKRGMGSIFVHGNSLYVGYYHKGKQIKERVGPKGIVTRGQAEQALKARMGEVVQGKFKLETPQSGISLLDLINKYLKWIKENQKCYKREAQVTNKFLEFIGNSNINELTSWQIEKYKSKRKQEGVKPSTINRELNVLRSMFNRAIEWGDASNNPLNGVKKAKPLNPDEYERKPLYIPNDVLDKIVENSPDNLKPFVVVARHTGMRLSELVNVKWSDVDPNKEYIYVKDSKNYSQRDVPLNLVAKDTLSKLSKESDNVFIYSSKDSVGKAWRRVLKKIGIKGYRPHDLRHSFITDLVTNGVDFITIMEITGHKDIRMLKRYSHPSNEHKKKAVKSLEKCSSNHTTITQEESNVEFINK